MDNLLESDARTWTFEVDGLHLDAPQKAKSYVYENYDVESYEFLRSRVIGGGWLSKKYVVVVEG